MRWRVSHRFSPIGAAIADRHYSRRTVGSDQFVAPGACLVLVAADKALWVSRLPEPQYVRHAWPDAWECATFRNEGAGLSSELIREAVAATRWRYGEPPSAGMITFVDPERTRHKRDPGRCFVRAGFDRLDERTKKRGLVVLRLAPSAFPLAEPPLGAQLAFEATRGAKR